MNSFLVYFSVIRTEEGFEVLASFYHALRRLFDRFARSPRRTSDTILHVHSTDSETPLLRASNLVNNSSLCYFDWPVLLSGGESGSAELDVDVGPVLFPVQEVFECNRALAAVCRVFKVAVERWNERPQLGETCFPFITENLPIVDYFIQLSHLRQAVALVRYASFVPASLFIDGILLYRKELCFFVIRLGPWSIESLSLLSGHAAVISHYIVL